MNKKYVLTAGIVIIVVSLIILFTIFNQDYKLSSWDGEDCLTHYKDCNCIGILFTMESFPAQYDCKGLNFCRDINVTECR